MTEIDFPDIPDFLIAKPREIVEIKEKPVRVKRQRFKHERFTIHLNNEVPAIGAGVRMVEAIIGRKWVRIRATGKTRWNRVPLRVWETLKARKKEK